MESGGVIPILSESDRKKLCPLRCRQWDETEKGELKRRGRLDFEDA
jgi:hypothetical protein